ncbi:protein-disulfide reductase DsbD domain-containing protein [Nitratireductor basaltis]|uniref:Thiol:disulfide interchange protein DsbD N-terminal domain-containing protein n=1 Tax=Nitratireductor basaltis TaxID=472175 RepID=A0A084UCR0_9HYPH|nr:protein-disulfide reductase DsbD domain-containing protein [Nitratireductor basaltis]KFB10746.1 hypothetical protein EL18_01786 [Nitratireductor basaltis]
MLQLRGSIHTATFTAMNKSFLIVGIAALLPSLAGASSSTWTESTGGAVRLVTSGLPDEDGVLRGALEIRLQPGWKTYWKEPGGSGIPPQLEFASGADVEGYQVHFPPPVRVDDEYGSWAGYQQSVALPVEIKFSDPSSRSVEGSFFLGICESVCIPFEGQFAFDPAAEPENFEHRVKVEGAFAKLAPEPSEGFQAVSARLEGRELRIAVDVPSGLEAPQLFVAVEGVPANLPELHEQRAGRVEYIARLSRVPEPRPSSIYYTITGDGRAVSGYLALEE